MNDADKQLYDNIFDINSKPKYNRQSKVDENLGYELKKEIDLDKIKVRIFGKNQTDYIDIRHYFKDRPTKRGIRLPLDIWGLIVEKLNS